MLALKFQSELEIMITKLQLNKEETRFKHCLMYIIRPLKKK